MPQQLPPSWPPILVTPQITQLYEKIITTKRCFPEHFRVGYFGQGFKDTNLLVCILSDMLQCALTCYMLKYTTCDCAEQRVHLPRLHSGDTAELSAENYEPISKCRGHVHETSPHTGDQGRTGSMFVSFSELLPCDA